MERMSYWTAFRDVAFVSAWAARSLEFGVGGLDGMIPLRN